VPADSTDGAWVDCPKKGGYPLLITNDTTWPAQGADAVKNKAWAHARHLDLLDQKDWSAQAASAATGGTGAVTQSDYDFIRAARDVGAQPVLRFEVTDQSSKFSTLPLWQQCSLLNKWSTLQTSSTNPNYHFIFPLYVHGFLDHAEYDSLATSPPPSTNTYSQQMQLIGSGQTTNCT
jgi:hypothetical protein